MLRELEKAIDEYTLYIQYGKGTALISFFLFLILLTINISVNSGGNWYIVLIPLVLTIISVTLVFNFHLSIQNIIDKIENNEVNIGTIISYFCLYILSGNLILYLTLLCLKLQNILALNFSMISIPIYVIFGVSLFYFIFILPALIQTSLYPEIALIISYMFGFFAYVLITNSKYDSGSSGSLSNCFISVWVVIGAHLLYSSYYVFIRNEAFINYFTTYVILTICLAFTILLCMKVDSKAKVDNWVLGVLLLIAYKFYLIEKIYQYYFRKDAPVEIKEKEDNKV